ncbi:MAG: RNA polymerase sigma factor [Limisphaerales bacterium]
MTDAVSMATDEEDRRDPDWFVTTRWTVVLHAGEPDSKARQQALATLCETYWRPLYAYVRRQGYGAHDAQDLTQEFFAFLMSRDHFAKADQDRGRFRSFLLGTLKKFLADQRVRAQAQKRGGRKTLLSLDFESGESRLARDAVAGWDPEQEFSRAWALEVLEQTMGRLRQEHEDADKVELFAAIEGMITGERNGRTYLQTGGALGISEGSVKMSVMRARRRYGELLREEIAQTVAHPGDIDVELRELFECLRA